MRSTIGIFIFILAVGLVMAPQAVCAGTILDTLGDAGPATSFDFAGSAGQTIFSGQMTGPAFFLSAKKTTLTEIGGYLDMFSFCRFAPRCPALKAAVVEIHPALPNGAPSPQVLAVLPLSADSNPEAITYLYSRQRLPLTEGKYFALFSVSDSGDIGSLLSLARRPFQFEAGSIEMGFLDPATGQSFVGLLPATVRILGNPPPKN